MPTKIYRGKTVTLSATEVDYELAGDARDFEDVVFRIGSSTSAKITTGPAGGAPVIDADYFAYTTEAEKVLCSVDTGKSTIRMSGSGTVVPQW